MESLINGEGNTQSHASSSLDSLKPSVLVIILILLMTLLISLSICFLLRCLNRCNNNNNNSSSSSSESFRFPNNHRVTPETERSSSSVLDSLPVFKFSSVTRRSNSSSTSNDCAVCLSKFEPEDQLRLLPLCCHAFHKDCIDVWLVSNQTCPLCRSSLFVSDSDLLLKPDSNSFRLEIGSISRRSRENNNNNTPIVLESSNRSYSVGSFDYIVDDVESEISEMNLNRKREETAIRETAFAVESSLAAETGNNNNEGGGGGTRSWLKEYVDRISSRAVSFRSSGRFFTGSSRRSEVVNVVDLEVGEEISEYFRWISGV